MNAMQTIMSGWMCGLLAAVSLGIGSLPVALADTVTNTATVDGITWTYTVSGEAAMIGIGSWGTPAISQSMVGPISIPSTLGGYPVTCIAYCRFTDVAV